MHALAGVNVHDFFLAKLYHLAATQEVFEIAWMAEVRALSAVNPIYGFLNGVKYQLFAIQLVANADRTLKDISNSPAFLNEINAKTRATAVTDKNTMQASAERSRLALFTSSGLRQGMPFIWQILIPSVAPYSLTTCKVGQA